MKKTNLLKKIVAVPLLTGMLAGTSYAGAKEDLAVIRDYVKRNPTMYGTINDVPFIGLRKDQVSVKTSDYYTLFEFEGGKFYAFCDHRNDGNIDRIVSMPGNAPTAEKRHGRLDCLSTDSLELELDMNDAIRSMRPQRASNRIVSDANKGEAYNFENGKVTSSDKKLLQKQYESALGKVKQILGLK